MFCIVYVQISSCRFKFVQFSGLQPRYDSLSFSFTSSLSLFLSRHGRKLGCVLTVVHPPNNSSSYLLTSQLVSKYCSQNKYSKSLDSSSSFTPNTKYLESDFNISFPRCQTFSYNYSLLNLSVNTHKHQLNSTSPFF